MKLNKTIGRVATTLVATAMLASLAAVPAFADEVGQFKSNTFSIQKHLQLQQNTFAPEKEFTFNVSVPSETNQPVTADEQAKGIEAGIAGAINASKTAKIEANALATKDGVVSVASDAFTVDVTKFSHAGVYKYVVTETSFEDDDFKYDTNVLVLYVHVKNDETAANKLSVELVELVDPDGASPKIDGFTNEYGKDNDEEDKLHDITLVKEIAGDQANLNAKFTFSVSVNSEYGNDTVLIVDTNNDGTWGNTVGEGDDAVADEVVILPADGTAKTISLGNGEKARIFNLTHDCNYTITEQDANKNGYTAAVKTDKYEEVVPTNGTVSAEAVSDDLTITYINTKTSVTPTGIVMNVAPYALLVVIAAAGCFVFLRKRRED